MSMSSNPLVARAGAAALGLAVLPALAVLGVRAVSPEGAPSTARAAAAAGVEAAPAALPTASAEQKGLLAAQREAAAAPFGPCPLAMPQTTALRVAAPEPPAEREEPAPEFALSGIVRGGGGAMAVINGRPRRLGDEVEKGWFVGGIDPGAGEVRLETPAGRRVTITLRRSDG